MENSESWAPRASLKTLLARSKLYSDIRHFFQDCDVLEIDTPALSRSATVDPNIDSFATGNGHWLQTSPEFAMKRLLARDNIPIYQIAHAFRREEQGRLHNPEFTLLEWYRPGWDYLRLMYEVNDVLQACGVKRGEFEKLSYREAFAMHAGLDPFQAGIEELVRACRSRVAVVPEAHPEGDAARRDFYLDLLMSLVVAPALNRETPQFIYDFPASQATLAKVRAGDPPVAERFELFWHGVELANGFTELVDAAEQKRRFEHDQERRRLCGQDVPPHDERLIAALESGMQPCAGVAIGLDRLLMLMLGLPSVADTLAFDFARI